MGPVRSSQVTYIRAPGDQEFEAAQCAAAVKADEEAGPELLGGVYPLVAMGGVDTIPPLPFGAGLRELLDGMIEKCIKQLLFAKGLKSISVSPSHSASSKAA